MPRKSKKNKPGNDIHLDNQWQPDDQWRQAWEEPENIDAYKKQALLKSIGGRIDSGRRKRLQLFFIGISAAAAVLLVIFIKIPGSTPQIEVSKWQELASNEKTSKILLADSTVLWLAPHSTIRIYPDFSQQRSTALTKGTVFFDVAKDERHPFTVAVNRQRITVLGTAFAVHRLDSVDMRLTVKEGKVALNNAAGRRLLTSGQEVRTARSTTGAIQMVDPADADWWLQRQIRWNDIPLESLLNRIENYYQVRLSYGAVDRKKKLTLTWDLALPLEDNLAVLNSLTGYDIH